MAEKEKAFKAALALSACLAAAYVAQAIGWQGALIILTPMFLLWQRREEANRAGEERIRQERRDFEDEQRWKDHLSKNKTAQQARHQKRQRAETAGRYSEKKKEAAGNRESQKQEEQKRRHKPATHAPSREEAIRILELKGNPTNDEIKKAYIKIIKAYHPDKNQQAPEAIRKALEEEIKKVNAARQTLLKK